jgi:hypothetical protein
MAVRLGAGISTPCGPPQTSQTFARTVSDMIRICPAFRGNASGSDHAASVFEDIQKLAATNSVENNANLVQQLIFFDLLEFDTSWADFMIVEVMALEDSSAKRIAYPAAVLLWTPANDAVLMNRMSRALASPSAVPTSSMLSSVAACLCPTLAAIVTF